MRARDMRQNLVRDFTVRMCYQRGECSLILSIERIIGIANLFQYGPCHVELSALQSSHDQTQSDVCSPVEAIGDLVIVQRFLKLTRYVITPGNLPPGGRRILLTEHFLEALDCFGVFVSFHQSVRFDGVVALIIHGRQQVACIVEPQQRSCT